MLLWEDCSRHSEISASTKLRTHFEIGMQLVKIMFIKSLFIQNAESYKINWISLSTLNLKASFNQVSGSDTWLPSFICFLRKGWFVCVYWLLFVFKLMCINSFANNRDIISFFVLICFLTTPFISHENVWG